MGMDVWRRDDHRQMPWKNGSGLTREVASSPPGSALTDFDWRISFAEVAAGGPFSTFPGVDRVIILVDGPAMALTVDGVRHELERHRPFAFDGTSPTTCEIPAGPTRDLNVMTRRGRIRADVEVLEPASTEQVAVESGTELVLVAITGHVLVTSPAGEQTTLEAMDGLGWNECAPLTLAGPGSLAAVRLTRPSSGRSSMVNEPPTDGSTDEPVSFGRPKDWAAGLPGALRSLQYSQAQMMSAVGCYPAEGEVP